MAIGDAARDTVSCASGRWVKSRPWAGWGLAMVLVACDAGPVSEDAAVDAGAVEDTGACATDVECDDGLYCNGAETCDEGSCTVGTSPCGASCDEATDACGACDGDGDGHDALGCGGDDCDDEDAARFPENTEVCDDAAHDEDCDEATFGARDADGDAHVDARCCNGSACGDDCDDTRADVFTDASEICDLRDNDCDGAMDEAGGTTYYPDADGDGYGSAAGPPLSACTPPPGHATSTTDCDDGRAATHPGVVVEVCNGFDDNCSLGAAGGGLDASEDVDGDLHAPAGSACTGGFAMDDCDDAAADIFPGAPELCDRRDNNCSSGGGVEASEDVDADGHSPTGAACSGGFPEDDCDDGAAAIYLGAPELCDTLDSDCSSGGGEDADGDLHAAPTALCTGGYPKDDCDELSPAAYPGAPLVAPPLAAPENGGHTGRSGLRPTFRWHPVGCGAMTYDLVVDDSCTTPGFAGCAFASPEVSVTGGSGTSHRPAADLPVSVVQPVGRRYYWRVRACSGASCSAWSAVRYVDVGRVRSDVNGDGYSDVLVGAYRQNAPGGNAFVYHGSAAGAPTSPSRTLANPTAEPGGDFAWSLASAGDLNGDGYADLVVGAPLQDAGASNEGNAFVYYGGSGGVPTTPSLSLDNPANQANAWFGYSVASAGDVNGDGYADLVVGASRQDAGASDEGSAFLYYGSAGGVPATPSRTLDSPANQSGAYFGTSVASAGDVNGDGYADLVVGAEYQDAGAVNEGNAFVYLGGASGVSAAPSATLDNPANAMSGRFGTSVASAGDVNGDGYADLVVGADEQSAPASQEGNVFVYDGSATGVPSTPSRTLDNPANEAGARFGTSVASAGDLDGDGYLDLVVGANYQGAADQGHAFVYAGGASGVATTPSAILDNPALQPGRFGSSVASAGDVNGDGYADIVVGAPGQDAGATDEGNAFTYHGGAAGVAATPSATLDSPGNRAAGSFGFSVGG